MGNFIKKVHILEPKTDVKRCVIAIHGRGAGAYTMEEFCEAMDIPDTLFVCPESRGIGWYAAPRDPWDQEEAVKDLDYTVDELSSLICKLKLAWHIKEEQICLMGHSAGAVLSLKTAIDGKFNIKCVISLAGAILEPENVPLCDKDTIFLLQHDKYDDCFKWHERYLPMEDALKNNNYNVETYETQKYGHNSFKREIVCVCNEFLSKVFNIKQDG